MTNNYLNTKQVADLFKVDNSTIRRWTLSEKLKCTSSNGGHRKFSYKHILDFIENHNKKLNLDLKQINNEKNVSIAERKKFITQNALDRNSIEILVSNGYFEIPFFGIKPIDDWVSCTSVLIRDQDMVKVFSSDWQKLPEFASFRHTNSWDYE